MSHPLRKVARIELNQEHPEELTLHFYGGKPKLEERPDAARLITDTYASIAPAGNPIQAGWYHTPLVAVVAQAVPIKGMDRQLIQQELRNQNPKVYWGCERPFRTMVSRRTRTRTCAVQMWVPLTTAYLLYQRGLRLRSGERTAEIKVNPYRPQRASLAQPEPPVRPQKRGAQDEPPKAGQKQRDQKPNQDGNQDADRPFQLVEYKKRQRRQSLAPDRRAPHSQNGGRRTQNSQGEW